MGLPPVLAGQRITANLLNGLPVTVAQLATSSFNNSGVEQVIGSFTAPAGDVTAVGQGYQMRIFGSCDSAAGTALLTWKLRLNSLTGTLVSTAIAVTPRTTTNAPFTVDAWLYFTAVGASGTVDVQGYLNEGVTSGATVLHPILSAPNIGTIDTTSAATYVLTALWGTAATGNAVRTLAGGMNRI